MAASLIRCVAYAAKSTEDRHGSIPDQLRDCRAAVEREEGRTVVAEYTDEAFSAFRRNRGPALVDAQRHVEVLAQAHGIAELWAQHSDRLARGDGRSARHAVELALWALKRDVRVRTVQDPDTFRDLLYAVVTGQRNFEDSRRKGLSIAGGRRRSAERGGYLGFKPDGYKRHVEIDDDGRVTKRLVIDPDRRPVIDMIFRLALRGRRSPAIARALNRAGWRTNPPAGSGRRPEPWMAYQVLQVLRNPRYAGLAPWHGEIVARECWPAYITERQHARLQAAFARRRESSPTAGRVEPYLLSRLAVCGRCGSALNALTRHDRLDGTSRRSYACVSKRRACHDDRCALPWLPAEMIEALFVSALPALLVEGSQNEHDRAADSELRDEAASGLASERQRLIDAVTAGEDPEIDLALERLFTRMSPEAGIARRSAISRRRAGELEAARPFQAWAEQEKQGRTEESRSEARKLNRLLRAWFTNVTVNMDEGSIEIKAQRRVAAGEFAQPPVAVHFDRTEQAKLNDRPRLKRQPWGDAEIAGALQMWAEAHGRSPRSVHWKEADAHHPGSITVVRHYGTWNRALERAGLKPSPPSWPPRRRPWTDDEITTAIRQWTAEHGQPPTWGDWTGARPEHPSTQTVRTHFGSWQAGLADARLIS